MLTLTLRQLTEKLPVWITARLSVALIGPPGTGKTYTSREVAQATGLPVEIVDGGQENEWKALFPYRTPDGDIQPGKALRANGGVLIIDESNRVPPELKSSFQLLASEKIVPWPDGGVKEIDIAIIATANDSDLGVEEASRAELDRYDLIVWLQPTPEEIGTVVAGQAGVRLEVAAAIYEFVAELARKLDPKKFHAPEGIRMAISIAKAMRTETLGAADVFRAAAERCFPLGRRGAERYRAEFDSAVADLATKFAQKMSTLGALASAKHAPAATSAQPAVATLADLRASLVGTFEPKITAPPMALPFTFLECMHLITQAFGMGVTKYALSAKAGNKSVAERRGVKIHFGTNGGRDFIEFRDAERTQVDRFLRLILA